MLSNDSDPITALVPSDALLALNNDHAIELSWLDEARFRDLVEKALLASQIGECDAFLLAFDQDADYGNANFRWFRERFARFVYVDRIVVAHHARGRGHAHRLYRHVFEHARGAGHDRIVCEVNSDPPNPASDAFHAGLNFTEIGVGSVRGERKTVRYLTRLLSPS